MLFYCYDIQRLNASTCCGRFFQFSGYDESEYHAVPVKKRRHLCRDGFNDAFLVLCRHIGFLQFAHDIPAKHDVIGFEYPIIDDAPLER